MSSDHADPRHDDLMSYFERSVATVRTAMDLFEHTYIRPKILNLQASFRARPIHTTFLTTFATLAFFPVISFLGFSLFILAAFSFSALACALVASSIAILTFASILAFTLFTLFAISALLTSTLISAFLFTRFILHIRSEGPRSGFLEWGKETRDRFYGLTSSYKAKSKNTETSEDTNMKNTEQVSNDTSPTSRQFDSRHTRPYPKEKFEGGEIQIDREDDEVGLGVVSATGIESRRTKSSPSGNKRRKTELPHHSRTHTHSRKSCNGNVAIKAGSSPELSSASESSSSSNEEESEHEYEREDQPRSSIGSTVIIEGMGTHSLGPRNGVKVLDSGDMRGPGLVEDSPILVKVDSEGVDYEEKNRKYD